VKGLSFAGSLPLIGVSTLEAMASPFSYAAHQVCSVIDARKKEVYAALFQPQADGSLIRLSNDIAVSPEELAAQITSPTLLIGDGADLYKDLFQELLGANAIFPPPHISFPRAVHIGFHAIPLWEQKKFLDAASATPIYIRPSDAEIQENKR
jgi:tRNA threonylcarbamoyladenosine biosynthesis protein TsaB